MPKIIDSNLEFFGSWAASAIPNCKAVRLDHEHVGIKSPMM